MFDVFAPGSTIHKKINWNDIASGASNTATSSGVTIAVYKDADTTESTSGASIIDQFDTKTGLVHILIDTASNASFYSVGSTFAVVATAGTVNGVSIANKVLYEFTISHLPNAAATIIGGTVTTGASTTSIPTSQFGIAAGSADQFKGRLIIFARFTTTAALRGQVAEITASTNSATPTLTVSPALTATPASGDTFIVI